MNSAKSRVIKLLKQTSAQLIAEHTQPVVFPIVVANYAARAIGEKLSRLLTDPEVLSYALYELYQRFNYDLIMVFTDVLIEAEAMGSKIEILADEPPLLIQPAGENCRIANPETDCRLPIILKATRNLQRMTQDQVFILVSIKGPFTLASLLCGPEMFLEQLITGPATARHYLKLATENQLRYLRAIINAGGVPFIGDPMASGSIISPEQFRFFALPFLQELVNAIHQLGLFTGLHICGDTSLLLTLMKEAGAEILSIDDVKLSFVRKQLGPETVIMGNVPTALLAHGTPEQVKEAAQRCLQSAMPKLVLASACDVPVSTPAENIQALLQAAREWRWS
uniref:Uroporphyrinogen decarboxylase (URO-D) domain-containing protein n=1 Tax=candidate division WOR-3 bacterium TaxID=2052148 RepID=A0A7V3UYZ2_UNCW3